MGVYSRFKKNPDGFRALVELLESTPVSRRERMIEVGREEDPEYTDKAVSYMMTFADVLAMKDGELAEVLAKAPPRFVAYAVSKAAQEVKDRFLRCAPSKAMSEIKDFFDSAPTLSEIGGAQLKLTQCARECERNALIQTKRIPPKL